MRKQRLNMLSSIAALEDMAEATDDWVEAEAEAGVPLVPR